MVHIPSQWILASGIYGESLSPWPTWMYEDQYFAKSMPIIKQNTCYSFRANRDRFCHFNTIGLLLICSTKYELNVVYDTDKYISLFKDSMCVCLCVSDWYRKWIMELSPLFATCTYTTNNYWCAKVQWIHEFRCIYMKSKSLNANCGLLA